jgi:hypothetical protein
VKKRGWAFVGMFVLIALAVAVTWFAFEAHR